MFDVITIGGATRDVFFMTEKGRVFERNDGKVLKKYLSFEYGSKVIPEDATFSYGGGGANSAISFSKLGLRTATVLRVGSEGTGSLIIKELNNQKVHTEFIHRDPKNHAALSVIVSVPGHDHIAFLYRGANDYLSISDWRHLKTKWFYLSSLTGHSADLIPELFSYARAHNIKVAWNPGSEQLAGGFEDLSSYLECTEILMVNREEAIKLVLSWNNRVKINDEKELLNALYQMTKKLVVITDGENGSYVTDGVKDYYEPAVSTDVVETTGSGDAYNSTFVAGQILGYSIKQSMRLAAFNSSNVVKYVGSQKGLMTFEELRAKILSGVRDEIKL